MGRFNGNRRSRQSMGRVNMGIIGWGKQGVNFLSFVETRDLSLPLSFLFLISQSFSRESLPVFIPTYALSIPGVLFPTKLIDYSESYHSTHKKRNGRELWIR